MTDLAPSLRRLAPELGDDWGTRWIVACGEVLTDTAQRTVMLMLLCTIHPKISGKRRNAFGENARIDEHGWLWTRLTRDGVDVPGETRIMPVDKLNSLLAQMIKLIDASEAERNDIVNRVQGWITRDARVTAEHVERKREDLRSATEGIELSDFEPEDFKT